MATQYTPDLRLAQMQPLDPSVKNAWGTIWDATVAAIEQAIIGNGAISIDGRTTYSLSVVNNTPDEARQAVYPFTGALTGDCTVTVPANPKVGWAQNATSGGHKVILTTGGGTTLTILPGVTLFWITDGTNVSALNVMGLVGLQPAYQLLTHDAAQSWYLGINDSDANALYIGQGYSAAQGVIPAIRVGANNSVLISTVGGTPGSSIRLTLAGTGDPGTTNLNCQQNSTGPAGQILFTNTNGVVGTITTVGSSTAYGTSSDYRIKTVFGPYNGNLIDQIKVHDAAFIDDLAQRYPMVIAHELTESGAGFAVIGDKDAVDANGDIIRQQVDLAKLIPAMIADNQQLRGMISQLEARVATLEAK